MSIVQAISSREQYKTLMERDEVEARFNRACDGVTVAIPCFEQSEYLAQCLSSVVAQTLPAFDTIVIDDGSRMEEAVRIEGLCREYGVRYVRVTNRGLPSARNTALMLTRTYAFLPLDADDWIEPNYIERTLPFLKVADVVVPGLQEHGETRNGTYMPGFDRPLSEVTLDIMWQFNRTFYCSLFRTELLRQIGGYNGRMIDGFEDYDMAIDLMSRGAKYIAVNEVLFNYRTRNNSMLSESMRKKDSIMAEMKRHHRYE